MQHNFRIIDRLLNGTTQTVAASQTDVPLTAEFPISHRDSIYMTVDMVFNGTGINGSATVLKLQTSFDGGTNWITHGTVGFAADSGYVTIRKIPEVGDYQGDLPMRSRCRIVISTDAGVSINVTGVHVSSRDN